MRDFRRAAGGGIGADHRERGVVGGEASKFIFKAIIVGVRDDRTSGVIGALVREYLLGKIVDS
jgi:hypothetical protein